MRRRVLLLLIALAACRDPDTRRVDPPPPIPEPSCGDGLLQEGEDCDQSALGTGSCQALGFDTGRLVCDPATCRYDTGLCVKRCGNGVLDLGEACDGALGLEPCPGWGFNACGEGCTVDTRHCVTTAFDQGPPAAQARGGPAVIGDLPPRGPGDLVMAVPSYQRVELLPWTMTQGFDVVAGRKLSFQRTPRDVEVVDLDGDGSLDVATLDEDGAVDLLRSGATSYALQTLDAGLPGARFLPTDGRPGQELVAVVGASYALISAHGVTTRPTPDATGWCQAPGGVRWTDRAPSLHEPDGGAVTLPGVLLQPGSADFDGDGDQDLVGLSPTGGVELVENTGVGFAARASLGSIPTGATAVLRAVDLDADGRADVAWMSGSTVVVRRNRGGWLFSEHPLSVPPASGPLLSFALGDADGDLDLDIAVTVPGAAPGSTLTHLWLNRVR